jgi:hypothetical protein
MLLEDSPDSAHVAAAIPAFFAPYSDENRRASTFFHDLIIAQFVSRTENDLRVFSRSGEFKENTRLQLQVMSIG